MAEPLSIVRMLAANAFFRGLGPETLEAVGALCVSRRLNAGESLFLKGDPGDALYAVRRGQIRISTGTDAGKRLTLNILGCGDVFGEIALLDGRERTADAAALEPCDLFVLQRRDFLSFLDRNPRIAIRLMEILCERLRWMSMRMEEATLLPVEARLARRLIMLAEDYGAEIEASQEELGQFVGAARESVNRQLRAWQVEGFVKLARSRVTVLAPERLAAIGRVGEM